MSNIITANTSNLIDFINAKDMNITIPIFQRNYDWSREECEVLFNDFLNLLSNNESEHFLGSIFYSEEKENKQYLIIDGQQRITTFIIFLISFYRYLENSNNEIDLKVKNKLEDIILQDVFTKNSLKLKLKFSHKEQQDKLLNVYNNDIDEIKPKSKESNIYNNFIYFF